MSPILDTTFYKNREEILNDLIASMQALVPDVYLGPDGNLRLIFEVEAGQFEMVFLSNQLLLEDLFVQSANEYALRQHGEQYALIFKTGTVSIGTLTIQGAEGTYIPVGSEFAHVPLGNIEPIHFENTLDGAIPAPGTANAPVLTEFIAPNVAPSVALGGAGGPSGTFTYRVTFVQTIDGVDYETSAGPPSNGISPANQVVNLTSVQLGDTGITKRKIYRSDQLVGTINDNTTTTFSDTGGAGGAAPPAAGVLNGLYEYAITFITADGETLLGLDSNALAIVNSRMRIASIPIGGTGTTGRKIYRQLNGAGDYKHVGTLNNNTTTIFIDNVSEPSLGTTPPTVNTANKISLAAQSREVGANANVAPATITVVSNAPGGITAVTNLAAFVGGTDPEDIEEYRQRLLERIRNPQTGSLLDLEQWAEEIAGVESATAFNNDNLGVATNGHVTVRISGSGGSVPVQAVIDEVQAHLSAEDIAGIVIHTATFTAVPTNVSVAITLDGTYTLADITPTVQKAIQDYINDLPVGGTVRIAGIYDAVFGLSGVADVLVTVPATNQTTTTTQKRTPGVITVT